jgi:hypothetical protein
MNLRTLVGGFPGCRKARDPYAKPYETGGRARSTARCAMHTLGQAGVNGRCGLENETRSVRKTPPLNWPLGVLGLYRNSIRCRMSKQINDLTPHCSIIVACEHT